MEKIWFIQLDGHQEGPFSVDELRHDSRITPDTFVWKEGFRKWIPIRYVSELKNLFKDPESLEPQESEEDKKIIGLRKGKDELVLDLQKDFPPLLFWILIILIIASYLFYEFYY